MRDAPLPNLICPLCGGPNGCVPALCGRFGERCWCEEVEFSSELLQKLKPDQRGKACICAACAEARRIQA